MERHWYECSKCRMIFGIEKNKDGLNCPECRGRIIPVPPPVKVVREDTNFRDVLINQIKGLEDLQKINSTEPSTTRIENSIILSNEIRELVKMAQIVNGY